MGKTWHCSEVPIANVPKSFYSVLMEQNGTSTELTAMEEHLARLLGISDLLDEDRPAGLKALEQSGLASQEALSRAISAARLEIYYWEFSPKILTLLPMQPLSRFKLYSDAHLSSVGVFVWFM